MLETPTISELRKRSADQFQAWLKEHVEPILVYMQAESERAPLSDVELSAVLDKAISPLVYWVRDNPLLVGSASQSGPVPATKTSSSPQNPTGGGSLSNGPPEEFLKQYGLRRDMSRDGRRIEMYVLDEFLGKETFRKVNDQMRVWGYRYNSAPGEYGQVNWFELAVDP